MKKQNPSLNLVLASGSTYRARLLSRLQIPFQVHSPDIDESSMPGEPPLELVKRLTIDKARKVAERLRDSWVIGSDQIAVCNDNILGKPGTHERAAEQLMSFSQQRVDFITGLCLINHAEGITLYEKETTQVYFKLLSADKIENYLNIDQPYDCAGSFKVESLGVTLFDKIVSHDPTALEGLPLIRLCKMFDALEINIDA